jgi:hypothetical protein
MTLPGCAAQPGSGTWTLACGYHEDRTPMQDTSRYARLRWRRSPRVGRGELRALLRIPGVFTRRGLVNLPLLGALLALLAPAGTHCRAAAFADFARVALHARGKLPRVRQRLGAEALGVALAGSPLGRAPLGASRLWRGQQSKAKHDGCTGNKTIHYILLGFAHFLTLEPSLHLIADTRSGWRNGVPDIEPDIAE